MVAKEKTIAEPPVETGKAVVLVVDDQREVLAAVRRLLRQEPYEVMTTESPQEALDLVERGRVDILISDERMPAMRGTDLLDQVRRRSPETIRVILTGYPGSSTVHYGLTHAVDWLISKPWNDDALRLTIRQLLEDRETKRRRRQETTRKRPAPTDGAWNHNLADFCEHASIPLHCAGPDGTILWANQAELDLLGYSRDEYVGRSLFDFHADPRTAQDLLARLGRQETIRALESRLRCKDGTIRDVLIDANGLWAHGAFLHSRCVTHDVTAQSKLKDELHRTREHLETTVRDRTQELRSANDELLREVSERKRAEETLRLSEERFRLLVESVKDYAILMLSPNGEVISWNLGAERLIGYSTDEILKRPFSIFYRPEDVAAGRPQQLLAAAARDGHVEDEGWRVRKDRTTFWCNAMITAVRDPSGRLLGFSKVTRDMTERRRAEEERERLNVQMLQGQKLQAIGQLSAGIAHEINNPVGYILSNLSTMGEYCLDLRRLLKMASAAAEARGRGEDVTAALAEFRKVEQSVRASLILDDLEQVVADCKLGGERIRDIVRSLRVFTHVDEGELKPTDLNKCIEDALRICWNELKYKAEVRKTLGDLPAVPCYPQRLGQVFMNLLVNAGQAIAKKGEIFIATAVEDGMAVVRIRDTGCGIPPENLKRIFEPFFTTKPVGSGTGLGLHVAYKIVAAHGGKIDVRSEPGQGTEFTVRLPLSSPAGGKS